MTDATIALKVDSSGLRTGQAEMDRLRNKGVDTEKRLNQSSDKMKKGWAGARTAAVGLTTAVGVLGTSLAVQTVVRYADAWQNATNQLKTVQKETENLADTQAALMKISNESRQGFESTANLYTRLTRSTESLGLSQRETIDLTNTINKSFAVSGASAQEASNAIIQLSQGLAAGALRGEEFNSVSEQSPILMQAIADNLQMTRGELRAFAAEGGITAEIVVESLQKASGEISSTFDKMTPTVEQSMTVLSNSMLGAIGEINEATGASEALSNAILSVSSAIARIPEIMKSDGFQSYLDWMRFASTPLRTLLGLTASAAEAMGILEESLDGAGEGMDGFIGPARQFVGPVRQMTQATNEASEAVNELAQEYSFLFRMQNRGRNTVETTTRSIAAQEEAVFDLINQLSIVPLTYSEIIARGREATFVMQGVTASTRDQQRATEFWTAVAEDGAKRRTAAERAAAEASYRNWERTHEFVTNTILDIADNGGSAFERLGDVAVATAKRIAAEWLALKAMNLFGISAPSGMGGGVGGSVASSVIGKGVSAVGSAVSGGFVSGGIGGAVSGGASAIGSALSAVPGWGWALAGVGAAAAALSKKSTPSTNAGMLVGPMGSGADPSRTFAVPAFASGFQPVGSARRADQSQAMEVINAFAAVDARLTEAIRAAGGHIDMSAATLSGFNEKGQGDGVFMGLASEKGTGVTSAPMDAQLSKYAQDVMRHAGGLTAEQKAAILNGIDGSHANGLARVPFDGYRAELHRNEEVLRADDPRNQNSGDMRQAFAVMQRELIRIGEQTKRTSDILLRVTRDGNALLTEAV